MSSAAAPSGGNPVIQASATPTPAAPAVAPSLPTEFASQIPEKFGGDFSKMVKAYQDAESELGRLKRQPVQQPQQQPQTQTQAQVGHLIENELTSSGKISDATRQQLSSLGFSDQYIAGQERFFQSEVTRVKTEMGQHSDGESVDEVIAYVNGQIGKGYSQQYVDALQVSISAGKYGAFKDAVADYKASKGAQLATPQSGTTGTNNGGFKDAKEFRAELAAAKNDPAKMTAVQKRWEATQPDIAKTFTSL